MKKALLFLSFLCCGVALALEDDFNDEPLIRRGDTVVLIGDSITEQGFRNPWGYYHVLTNALPQVNFIPLGYSGYQVKGWSEMERDSVSNTNRWTWYRNPGWNLKTVFDGKVDVVMIFLGMNDILQPSIHDTEEDIVRWVADYAEFVTNIRNRCHPRQFLFATITPLTGDWKSPKNRIRRKLNSRLRSLADMMNAGVVDFGTEIESAQTDMAQTISGYRLVPDFVHPNKVGHTLMAAAFCQGTRLFEETEKLTEEFASQIEDAMNDDPDLVHLSIRSTGLSRPQDDDFTYTLTYSVDNTGACPAEVRPLLPEGWTADQPFITADSGSFLIRGKPTSLKTTLVVEATLSNGTNRGFVDVPAPWLVREDDGPWQVYTASVDYTGGNASGSIDPYQVSFGWKTNTLTAKRRVWSEKARDVKAVLSHQGFSETLDLTVKFDGKEVWKDKLNRNGRNRIEKTLSLKEGWNDIEITCVHHDWQRQFAFDLEPLAGDDLSTLKYALK